MPTKDMMHIGFDISQTGHGKAGCGYYAHAMIQALLDIAPEHRYSLYPSFGDFYFDVKMPIRNPYKQGQYGPRHLTREMARNFWTKQDAEAALDTPNIVHSNNFWCPTQLTNSRLIYTLYDMGFLIDPTWTTERNREGCFSGVFAASIQADWIVAISEASKTHFLNVFPHFPENRIQVIYPCSRFSNANAEGKRPATLKDIPAGEFWLTVGTIEPRKNHRRLAEAYALYLAKGGKPMPLVFAGGEGWMMDDFQNTLKTLGIEQQTILTGYVSDDELIWLYRNCYANLYPSLFEGFGLPVLEGMQFGAATLTSQSTSMSEITGDAALLLPTEDHEAWTHAMIQLSNNPGELKRLKLAAKAQAQQFSWKQSATSLLQLYNEALIAPKRCQMK